MGRRTILSTVEDDARMVRLWVVKWWKRRRAAVAVVRGAPASM